MHSIEPFFAWRDLYIASEDDKSPFYGREYSEFEFTNTVYNYFIHPQWDAMESATLYLKILYTDYNKGFSIIELMGEWNDLLYNDVMYLKRYIVEVLIEKGIDKFILIGENVMNFHAEENDYYQEWFDEIEEGWIVGLNFRDHVIEEFARTNIDYYISFGGKFNEFYWQKLNPIQLFDQIHAEMSRRLMP